MTIKLDTCTHCEEPIYEDPDAVLHRWKHISTNAYLCWPPRSPQTQATPVNEKEDE